MSRLAKLMVYASLVLLCLASSAATYGAGGPASGSQFWVRADVDVTVSNGKVSFWADKSGAGKNAYMYNAAYQPTLVNGAINNLPVIRFSGAQSLILTTPINPIQFTIFIVGKNNNPSEDFGIILGPYNTWPNNQIRWENGSQAMFVGTGNSFPVTQVSIGSTRVYHALALRYDGSTLNTYRNGGLVASQPLSTSGAWILSQIGAWYASYFLVGDIAEIIVYPTALSSGDLATTTNYLKTKYALP